MPETTALSRCTYHPVGDRIHEFVFVESSREAYDEFLTRLQEVTNRLGPGERLLLIMDWRKSGMPPMRYAFQRSRENMKKYPNAQRGRSAILYNYGTLISLAQSFAGLLGAKSSIRFFHADERDLAIEWLLRD